MYLESISCECNRFDSTSTVRGGKRERENGEGKQSGQQGERDVIFSSCKCSSHDAIHRNVMQSGWGPHQNLYHAVWAHGFQNWADINLFSLEVPSFRYFTVTMKKEINIPLE